MSSAMFHSYYTVVLFIIIVGIWAWAWSSRRKRDFDEASRLPLDDDAPTQNRGEG